MMINSAPRWMLRGLCRGADPTIFDGDRWDDETAKEYCRRCPVRNQCLDYSLQHTGDVIGVWGGLNDDERAAYRRGGPRKTCPGCRSTFSFSDGTARICLSCGLSWKL